MKHLPSLAIVLSTFAWGTWWIPLRKLDHIGEGSIWFTGLGALLPALFFLPHALKHRKRIYDAGWPLFFCALCFGVTCACYAEGAMRGNVARVILLFYLTPVWSTLLASWVLGEAITGRRILTIVLGLCGMWIILGGSGFIPVPADAAEWMGLVAGIFWAMTTVAIQKNRTIPIADTAFPAFLSIAICFLLLTLIPGGRDWNPEPLQYLPQALGWALAIALIWQMPAIILTLYGARSVEPGRVAVLLMLEVVIGVGSAALLTDEQFGIREITGTLFVMAAGFCEFIKFPQSKRLYKA